MIHIIHQAIEEGILPNDEGHTQGIAFFDEESSSSGSNNLVNMNPATAELFILAKEGDINNMRSYLFDLTQPQTAAAEQIDYDDLVEFAGTPLIYACENGNLPMVRLLIQEGASLLMLSENGYYPYLASCLYGGRDEITAFLLMLAGVDEDCKDHLEQNALMIALLSERYELVRKLCLWPGVNINAQDNVRISQSLQLVLNITVIVRTGRIQPVDARDSYVGLGRCLFIALTSFNTGKPYGSGKHARPFANALSSFLNVIVRMAMIR
eukprot:scaffold146_cov171-Ochromonas_danica.AAC.2